MSDVCFVDTECTGLDPDRHQIWEVGLIDAYGHEHRWFLPVDLGRADPIALEIGHFHDRYDRHLTEDLRDFAHDFAWLTRGCHLAGAVVSFDEERLRKLLSANGACPEWHYHIIDVEALAVGYLCGRHVGAPVSFEPTLPWRSDDLSRMCGVEPPGDDDRHTALGDARWAKAIYEAVTA
jgi:hypothetical protein